MDNNIIEYNNYGKFKQDLDTEIKNQANSFVKVGYMLKVARDTNILFESGYKSMTDFAWGEYHLKKDAVSRYVGINDNFSVDGYSDRIKDEYAEYGVAKLGEMLTLPESVIEMMSPKLTREVIQDLKRELKEEEKISDIEVALEPVIPETVAFDTLAGKLLYEYFHHERAIYKGLYEGFWESEDIEDRAAEVIEWMAPSGIAVITERISGMGKILLTMKEESGTIDVLNIRANDKESYSWTEFIGELAAVLKVKDLTNAEERWTQIYGEPFEIPEEKKEEVAPVQPKAPSNSRKIEKSAQKVQKKVEKPEALSNSTKTENLEEKEQVEGQKEITEYFDDKGDYKIPEEETKETEPVTEEETGEVAPVQPDLENSMITIKRYNGTTYVYEDNIQVAAEPAIDDALALVTREIAKHLIEGGTANIELA